uniref:mRNA interferase HicA n=1 Tax=Candidatus Kentrum sp. SD TaxID=2126332 RepID=A0A451BHF3_9GAMM|nr:MAG: mRNA interferase HicA [Candidatus Kentron sp. SD]VFK48159.1 MAG: mRNA interferase HicA [Candidatus Kentron sp. SD]VFK77676.1 MAG: mRNA interferase HicA [Candidatus Kentron sp. SD]
MKRSELIRHLLKNNCELLREGSRHSIWRNVRLGDMTAVPRHNEIKEFMALKICRDLNIEKP